MSYYHIFTYLYIYTQSDSTTQVNPTTQLQFDDSIQCYPIPTIDCAAGRGRKNRGAGRSELN